MSRAVMQQAFDAMSYGNTTEREAARIALREALARPGQEPVLMQERRAKRMSGGVVTQWSSWYSSKYRTPDEAKADEFFADHIPHEWRHLYVETPQPKPQPEQPAPVQEPVAKMGMYEHKCPNVTGHRGPSFVCQKAGHGVGQNSYCKGCICPEALNTSQPAPVQQGWPSDCLVSEKAKQSGFDLSPMPNLLYTVRGNHAQLVNFARAMLAAAPQPEQEPVAWFRYEDGMRIYYETKAWDDLQALYPAPPQRQPLTPEEQGYVPLSDDGKSVFIDGFGEVPLAYPSMQPPLPEQPEQEPVARVNDDGFIVETGLLIAPGTLLYATPPKREWVGLTDDEKSQLWVISRAALPRYATYASLVEAKLKGKNT